MSKYIIELDENAKKVVAISLEDGIMWTDETEVENLEELNSDYINEHYGSLQDEAYQRGIEEGKKATWGLVADASSAEYQRGLEDGKSAIYKGCEGCRYSGTPQGDSPCFNCSNYYPNNWNKQDDNIEVGDEVRSTYGGKVMEDFTPWVVTLITSETCYGFDADGKPRNNPNTMVQKTGRHFDIESILEDMRE